MSRRRFVSALALAAFAPGIARAQTGKVRRIGLLSPFTPGAAEPYHQAFRLGLRDLGWVEGKNIVIEYRYSEGRDERLTPLAADLVGLNVEIIVTSITPDALAAKAATASIPIVMAAAGEPVASGLIESLARPGGNVTGLSQMTVELGAKRLELLKQLVPNLSRVAVLWNPNVTISTLARQEIELPAKQMGLQLHSLEARRAADLEPVFGVAAKAHVGAVAIMPAPLFTANMKSIADVAARNRVPSIYNVTEFAEVGGLATFGPDRVDLFRRAATFVDKILKGAKPGDLPIEQPNKFELVINRKTANALGIKIPQSILLRANRVIE